MGSEPPAVELDGVTREYGDTTALDDVSVSVREGEFFTLVGPSGCGKTTTLRLLAGFETPDDGRVRFGGDAVDGVPPEDRDVGVVFQNYALFPHMSVGENVAYGLRFADPPGGASRGERVAELLDLVDLPDAADRDPDTLSGGQQQRVAMARALAPGPDVLLLDEPMSALDAKLRERLRVQVREIQRELGITTVYVTHDQEEALAVSDRVAVVDDGRVEQVGPPREIYRRPATRFVAEFVGDNNVLTGRVGAVETGPDGPVAALEVQGERLTVGLSEGTDVSAGDRLTICVRPERLTLGEGTTTLSATVTSAEFLGESTRVHLDWRGQALRLRTVDPPAESVTVGFDPGDAHVIGVNE
ncbi:ABC transporter ATP-binding protein [Haloarcula litorea]|uniref:ABC transporter ATP-binding protein n=1 Tax=Haloarcula litorea TaxID=3032579 RepID=UPI003AF32FAC